MKKTIVYLLLLLVAVGVRAQGNGTKVASDAQSLEPTAMEPIKLAEPNLERGMSVMQALLHRQSTRQFDDRDLSMADLSDLLWAANGINRPESGKRTAPSAMNRQEIAVYVCMKDGNYFYDAKQSMLVPVSKADVRPLKAPVVLVLVGPDSKTMTAVDAGIVSQNISIFCAAAGLATVPRATMDIEALKTALKLQDGQVPLMNHPVGYFVR